MGRKFKPIEGDGPVQEFARELRALYESVPGATIRWVGERANCSPSTVAEAMSGTTLPSQQTLRGIVRVLGGTVSDWCEFLDKTERSLQRLKMKAMEFGPLVDTTTGAVGTVGHHQLSVVQPELAAAGQCSPDPDAAHTFEDVRFQLTVLRIAAGSPSYRDLAKRCNKRHSASAINEVMTGQRTPGHELFAGIVELLLGLIHDEPKAAWQDLGPWLAAWRRAEYNRLRPDLKRRRRRGELYLVTTDQDRGPMAGVIAKMPTEPAAALLASLPEQVAADIVMQLPAKEKMAIVTAMAVLTSPAVPVPPPPNAGGDEVGPARLAAVD